MHVMARPSRKKSWQTGRERVSVLADLAIRKETVVRKLTELREAHDLTQERAAAKVGVTVRQWQRWESGASVPYARNLSAIAGSFGIDEGEFFDASPPPPQQDGQHGQTQLDRIERALTTSTGEGIAALLDRQSTILEGIERLLKRQDAILKRIEAATKANDDSTQRLDDAVKESRRRLRELESVAQSLAEARPETGGSGSPRPSS